MKAEKLNLHDAAMKCMKRCPTANKLRKIAEILPSETAACEDILEKQSPEELLNFQENVDRASDALSLIKRSKTIWQDRIFTFYKENKKKFPEDAGNYFRKAINENLKNTGDQAPISSPTH